MNTVVPRLIAAVILATTLLAPPVSARLEIPAAQEEYLFGSAGVDENLELYSSEIESNRIPTNAHTLVKTSPADDPRARRLSERALAAALIVMDHLLFIREPSLHAPCGPGAWRHSLNYQERFDDWLEVDGTHVTPGKVAVLVINSEASSRCISFGSLEQAPLYVTRAARNPLDIG